MEIPFARSLRGLFSPNARMREDWDLRARRDARFYIDCGHGGSEDTFWKSGEEDLSRYVLRSIELARSAATLEIGCGIGRLLKPLSERVARATGVDISGEMIRRAAEALAGRPNVRLLQTRGDLAGVADGSVDFVYSHIVFQHVPSKEAIGRYFDEAARVLRSGGILRFQVDGRAEDRLRRPTTWEGAHFRADEVRSALSARGFDVVDQSGEGTQYLWTTSRRRPETGRPSTDAVRAVPRKWDPAALDALLSRLGPEAEAARGLLLSGATDLRQLVEPFLAGHTADRPRDYVAAAYRTILGREPDEGGLAYYAGEIEQGTARTNVIDCLLSSAEFDERHRRAAESPTSPSHTS